MLAEFLPPDERNPQERRHIVSVFKLVQDLLEPSRTKNKSHFQVLMSKLPSDHKAKWFAGATLNSADQAMDSVMSTVLSRLNAFLDSELEQILCFDSAIDAEKFASEKSAIFLILPEEDTTKNFMAGLMIQNMSRELFAVADENGGKLKNRVDLEHNLPQSSKAEDVDENRAYAVSGHGGMAHEPAQDRPRKRNRGIKTMEEDNA